MRRERFISSVLLTAVVAATVAMSADYKPLGRRERRGLRDASSAIKIAGEKERFVHVREFAPAMLQKYKSVMLDPNSVKYRIYYAEIESVYNVAVAAGGVDNWQQLLSAAESDSARMAIRDKFITYLRAQLREDLAQGQEKVFKAEVKEYIEANRTMEGYGFIAKLGNVPLGYKEKVKGEIEQEYSKIVVELSTTTDLKKLRQFQRDYPDLFASDVATLIKKQKDKRRLSLLREPSGEAYRKYVSETGDTSQMIAAKVREKVELELKMYPTQEKWDDYFASFPEPGEQVVKLYEDYLYRRFKKELTIERALAYLEAYPEGSKAKTVRVWVKEIESYGKKSDTDVGPAGDAGSEQPGDG